VQINQTKKIIMGNATPKEAEKVSPENLDKIDENVYMIQSNFNFLNVAEVGLNGLVIHSKGQLVYINPPKFTPKNRGMLQTIEEEMGAKIKIIVQPGDWHHMQLPDAQKYYPDAKMYVASERNLRKQKTIKATVIDRVNPDIPELGDDFVLVPWLGYTMDSMPWVLSGAKKGDHRIEFVIFHKPSSTLFLTDQFLPPKRERGATLWNPFAEPNNKGFKLVDLEAARESIQRVLALDAKRVVFSHGARDACVVPVDTHVLTNAYEQLLKAHGVQPVLCAGGSHLILTNV